MEERKEEGERREVELSGLGMDMGAGEWTPIERIKTRQVYDKLIAMRMKLKDYTAKNAHENVKSIQEMLIADERNYWWRFTHRVTPIKKRESKWRKDKNGENSEKYMPGLQGGGRGLGSL